MTSISWTRQVETFLAELRQALSAMGATLEEDAPIREGLRRFRVPEAELETSLLLFPTPQSPQLPLGEFRVITQTMLPPGVERDILRSAPARTHLPTLGTINRDGRSVAASAVIEMGSPGTLAGVMATSLMHAGPSVLDFLRRTRKPSMLDAMRRSFARKQEAPPAPASPSAWSELDLARMHFDLGHLAGSVLEHGTWRHVLGPLAISLTAVDDQPYFGGGLLSRVEVAKDLCTAGGVPVSATDLNAAMILETEEPAFGAWVEEATHYSFQSFLPNSLQALREFEEHWVAWSLRRAVGVLRLAEAAHAIFANR